MPDTGPAQQLQGALAAGNYPRAIAILSDMLKVAPRDPAVHYNLGMLYSITGKAKDAERHLREAASLDPQRPEPRIALADSLAGRGQTTAARDALTEALVLDPANGSTATKLATLLFQSGRKPEAPALFRKYADTASHELLMAFAQILMQLELREESIAAYDLAAERAPYPVVENTTPAADWVKANSFTAENPSKRYGELVQQYELLHQEAQRTNDGAGQTFDGIVGFSIVAPYVRRFSRAIGAKTLLDYGGGRGAQYKLGAIRVGGETSPSSLAYLGVDSAVCFDPGFNDALPEGTYDLVICVDALEHCDRQDLPWIIRRLFSKASKGVFVNIASYAARKVLPNGENAHCTVEEADWWMGLFSAVAKDFPHISYEAIVSKDLRQVSRVVFGRRAA